MTSRRMIWTFMAVLLVSGAAGAAEGETKILNGFNDEAEAAKFKIGVKVELVAEHVTEGKMAGKLTYPAGKRWAGMGIVNKQLMARWGDYDYFVMDVYNPYEETLSLFIRVDDDKSKDSDYTTYYGKRHKLLPGANQIKIKTARMPNQVQPWLQRKLNPNKLVKLYSWLSPTPKKDTVLYFDNVRLMNNPKVDLPKGLMAFDFGGPDADCWPGFTHVTPKSAYSDAAGFGFGRTSGLGAYDDSFGEGIKHGEGLTSTSVGRRGGMTFTAKLAPGKYKIWCATGKSVYPKQPYTVTLNGRTILDCKAGDRLGDLDIFGKDYTRKSTIWESHFLGQICDEYEVETEIKTGKAEFKMAGTYVSWMGGGFRAIMIRPVGNRAAEKGFADIQKDRKDKFLAKWRELKPRKVPAQPRFTAAEKAQGFMLAYRHYAERISPWFVPSAADRLDKLSIAATPGEKEPAVFMVYPTKDAGKAEVTVSDLKARRGTIPASAVTIEYVHYRHLKSGGGMDVVASHVVPRSWIELEKGIPRQFWMTVNVPEGTRAGKYTGTVTVKTAGGRASFKLETEVYPFKLDSVADCGLIYAHIWMVPKEKVDIEAFVKCLTEHNVNSATVSGVIKLKGKGPNGKPTFDFSRLDMTMEIMKAAGMTGPVPLFDMSIQGEGGGGSYPHLGFTRAPYNYKITDQGYYDAMTELTTQLRDRAKEKNYLPILMYPVTELSNDPYMGPPYLRKLVKAFRKVDDVKLICSLNTPKDIVCAELLDHMMVNWGLKLTEERLARIRKDGAKLWYQNIGQSRYTDGFLMLKTGAIGRRQWAITANAGGRTSGGDPYNGFMGTGNSSLVFCAANKAIPNMTLKWMSEGADDFRYATKLLSLIKEAEAKGSRRAKAAADEAQKAYDGILAQFRVNTGGARIEIDGRCDKIGDFTDKSIYDRFRKEIAGHIIKLNKALGKRQ